MTTQQSIAPRKAKLEQDLSEVVGVPIEITIRGLRDFTLSAEGDKTVEIERARAFFGSALKTWEAQYDAECDMNFAYFTL